MKETAKIIPDEISSDGIYTINKTLKLNTVNEGEPTDNILVHGADNEVKSVPRAEFVGKTPNITQVLTKGNTYSTYGQNDYMQFTNQYAPGWQFNSMQFMPGGIRLEKSYGGNSSGILYAADHVGSLYTRSDFANQTGFSLNTEGLLLKTNVSEAGTGIIKSDNLVKLTDYQLPVETTEASITLVSKVNGILADENGNINIPIPEGEFKTINGESIIGSGNIEISGSGNGSGNKQEYVAKIRPSINYVNVFQNDIGSITIDRVQPYAYSITSPNLTQMSKVIVNVSLDSNTSITDNRTIDYKTGNNAQGQIILLMRQNNVLQAYSSEQSVDISLKITVYN